MPRSNTHILPGKDEKREKKKKKSGGLVVKNLLANAGDTRDAGSTHSSILAQRIPWKEAPSGYSP